MRAVVPSRAAAAPTTSARPGRMPWRSASRSRSVAMGRRLATLTIYCQGCRRQWRWSPGTASFSASPSPSRSRRWPPSPPSCWPRTPAGTRGLGGRLRQDLLGVAIGLDVVPGALDRALLIDQEGRAEYADGGLAVAVLLAPRAVGLHHLMIEVRQQREAQPVLLAEGAVAGGVVRGDADHRHAGPLEPVQVVVELAGFRGAAGGVVLWVEVDDHLAALEIVQGDGLAVLVREAEWRRWRAGIELRHGAPHCIRRVKVAPDCRSGAVDEHPGDADAAVAGRVRRDVRRAVDRVGAVEVRRPVHQAEVAAVPAVDLAADPEAALRGVRPADAAVRQVGPARCGRGVHDLLDPAAADDVDDLEGEVRLDVQAAAAQPRARPPRVGERLHGLGPGDAVTAQVVHLLERHHGVLGRRPVLAVDLADLVAEGGELPLERGDA